MSSLFRGMMPVSVAFQKDGETTEFASVILDFAEDEFMVIGAPIQTDHGIDDSDENDDAGEDDDSDEDDDSIDPDDTEAVNESDPILMPEAGDEVTIEITLPDGIRRFTSVVESEVVGPAGIRVEWPSSAERIQRRDYVRIDCFLETEVTFGELESEDERTIDACATDLSGGGARLTMTEAPEPETRIHLRIRFSKTVTHDFTARVVRAGELESTPTKQQFWVAVEFMDMTEARRNEIARFIFDKEREQRRKGVA